ncbi:MAG: type I glutamate--ammonia ligase [Vulcanimicrobiaceae bacterium]
MHSLHNGAAKPATKRDVVRLAKDRGVRFVRLVFADILGASKNVAIPVSELEGALNGGVTFDGGSIEELDMVLRPDVATFAVYPWNAGAAEARLICDIATPDGAPFEGCPRTTLKRVLENTPGAAALRTALEVEFYLFERDGDGATDMPEAGSYFDFSPNDRGEEVRTAIVAALESMGVGVASSHHEHGTGQHEIDLPHVLPLSAADDLFTLRDVAKHVAAQYRLHATFMPKPDEARAGSGLHVNFSLGSDEASAGDNALPDEALYFIGGLLEHVAAPTAECNSTVNSYKRLVAAWDAPIYTGWSRRSANALVRVPPDGPPRIEMRSPDAAGNPYLTLATLIAAGCDGIERRRLPGDPLVGTTYDLSEAEKRERGIATLPKSLRQAIVELDADPVIRKALGDHIYHAFRDSKRAEYERYRRAVHPWERRAYLRV